MNTYVNFAVRQTADQVWRTILLLDQSGSMDCDDWQPTRLAGAKEAAEALLNVKLTQHPDDQVGIGVFGDSGQVIAPLAKVRDHAQRLKKALHAIHTDGSTNINGGLHIAASMLQGTPIMQSAGAVGRWLSGLFLDAPPAPTPHHPGQVILLTDGAHNVGGRPFKTAEKLKADGVQIDVIGIGGSPAEVNEKDLKRIASINPDGSPRYCFIGDKHQLIREFQRLAHHLRPL